MASSLLRVVGFNLASANDGPGWNLGEYGDVDLHHLRSRLVMDEVQAAVAGSHHNRRAEASEGAQPGAGSSLTVPVICLQESVLPTLDSIGFTMVSAPGTRTHANWTTLFVPDREHRRRLGVVLEAETTAGPDHPEGTTYNFPIASLLVPASSAGTAGANGPPPQRVVRVIVGSVHLSPFGSSADKRTAQLRRITDAMKKLDASLGCNVDFADIVDASDAPKGKTSKSANRLSKCPVDSTIFVIAGDCNQRDNESHPDAVFSDAFLEFQKSLPEFAYAHVHTFDTSTGYNGKTFGREYKSRYDRAYSCRVAHGGQQAGPSTATAAVADWYLLGAQPYVSPALDALNDEFEKLQAEDPDAEVVVAPWLARANAELVPDANGGNVSTVLTLAPREQTDFEPRFLSDHFGFCCDLAL